MGLFLVLSVILLLNRGYCGKSKFGKRRSSEESSSIEYFTEPTKQINIPVMIHFDTALTQKLAKEYNIKTRKKLKDVSRRVLKEMEVYFRHPTLNQTIQFSLKDTKFIRKNRLETNDNGSIYLKNYCNRQATRKKESRQWWYSILLTGRDLFYLDANGHEIRSSTGRGYMGGVCAIDKSCTVIEWNPKTIGYLLSHEMGHSLGMMHDGTPYNACKPYRNIMSTKYHPRYHPRSWSRCSRMSLQRFLQSSKAWCLRKNHSGYRKPSTGRHEW